MPGIVLITCVSALVPYLTMATIKTEKTPNQISAGFKGEIAGMLTKVATNKKYTLASLLY